MTLGLVFWIIMIVLIVFGLWGRTQQGGPVWSTYNGWVNIVLFALLGIAVFGFDLHR